MLVIFLWSLVPPIRFYLGPLHLTPSRLVLLVALIPLILRLINAREKRLRPSDILVFAYAAWINVSIFSNHGLDEWQNAGINTVEILGAYLIGRTLITDKDDYKSFLSCFLTILIFLLPFVLFEQITRRMLLSEILGTVFQTLPYVDHEMRLGLNRVQATFDHPILFGLFCSIAIANFFYIYQDRPYKQISTMSLAYFMTFMSLSSAPLLSMMLQTYLIIWGKLTNSKWKLLAIIFAAMYILIDLLSNRSPVQVFISYATLNAGTAWWRIHIWDWGILNVRENPIFGIGLNDWERPYWMVTASMDNFWLVNAVRYGIPGLLLLASSIIVVFWGFRKGGAEKNYKTAYGVAAVGLYFTLGTVHAYGSVWLFFLFYLGAGVWLSQPGEASVSGRQAPLSTSRRTSERPSRTSGRSASRSREATRSP